MKNHETTARKALLTKWKIDKRIDKENTFVGKTLSHEASRTLLKQQKKTFYLFKTQINKKNF